MFPIFALSFNHKPKTEQMNKQKLQQGIVYEATENLLPIHHESAHYQRNGRVIPDGTNWVEVNTVDGKFVINGSETDYLLIVAKDEVGNNINLLRNYANYLRARDKQGNEVYFTSEDAAENNKFKFSLNLSSWVDSQHPEFYGDTKIFRYHSNHNEKYLPKFIQGDEEWKFGVEVEKVDDNLRNEGLAYEILQETGWKKEEDGSLGSSGYELISPVLPLFNWDTINKAVNPVINFIDGKVNEKCGGHMTISRRGWDTDTLMDALKPIAPILYALYPKRCTNHFCQAKLWRRYSTNGDKYSAFRPKNGGLVEIRLFGRIKNVPTLYWRIELMQILMADAGNNLNQFCLKFSSQESRLYKHVNKQYARERIFEKMRDIRKFSEMYGCGKISKTILRKINDRFRDIGICFPDVEND